jgi:hypothetical protein
MAEPRLFPKQSEHAACDHRGLRLVDASAGHAAVSTLNDNGDPVGSKLRFQGAGYFRCHSFLKLEPLGKCVYDPSNL